MSNTTTTSRRLFSASAILRNFLFLMGGEALSKFLLFIALTYVARTLGPNLYGEIGFALVMVSYFYLPVTQAFDVYGIREIARQTPPERATVDQLVTLRMLAVGVLFVILVLIVLATQKQGETRQLILWYGPSVFLFALSLDWYFQGTEKMFIGAVAKIVNQSVNLLLLLWLIRTSSSPLVVAKIYLVSTALMCLTYYGFYSSSQGFIRPRLSTRFARPALAESFPIILSFFLFRLISVSIPSFSEFGGPLQRLATTLPHLG